MMVQWVSGLSSSVIHDSEEISLVHEQPGTSERTEDEKEQPEKEQPRASNNVQLHAPRESTVANGAWSV